MESKYFSKKELACRCGCGLMPTPELVVTLDKIRDWWGKPINLTCAARCPAHNKAVGGAPKSAHIEGKAADLHDPDGAIAKRIVTDLQTLGIWIENPFKTKGWLHVQIRPTATRVFNP